MPDYFTHPTHEWVGACYLPLNPKQAEKAEKHGRVRMKPDAEFTIDVPEVMCSRCRRPYEDCLRPDGTFEDCTTGIHLRGGPIGERKKRKGVVVDGGGTEWDDEETPIYRDVTGTMRGPS